MAISDFKISAPENALLSSFRRANMALNNPDPWIKYHNHLTEWVDEAAAWIAEQQGNDQPRRILDVACGTGSPALYFARQYPDAHLDACDLNGSYLELAVCLATELGLHRINFTRCAAEQLPYDEHAFDMLSCFFSLMYFQGKEKAIDEFLRVVRPGGSIWITTWAGYNALFDCVRSLIPAEKQPSQSSDQHNPHLLSDEDQLLALLEDRSMTSYTIQKEQIQLKWKGTASELWDFVKASNPTISDQLKAMEAKKRLEIDYQIIHQFSKYREKEYLLFPVDMLVCQIRS